MSIKSVDVFVICDGNEEDGCEETVRIDVPYSGNTIDWKGFRKHLKEEGWSVSGDRHLCPECTDEAAADAEEEDEGEDLDF